MGTLYTSLALCLLLSTPVPAQWWNFFWASPKSSPQPSPPFVTSPSPLDMRGTTAWVGPEDKTTGSAFTPVIHTKMSYLGPAGSFRGSPPPGVMITNARSHFKPLKRWKSGECSKRRVEDSFSMFFSNLVAFWEVLYVAFSMLSILNQDPESPDFLG